MKYPRIFLAADNCFAYKRWTSPDEWSAIMQKIGIKYIEASADTELDPLYMGVEYLEKWVSEVEKAQEKYGVQVVNLYSGHGTYTTLGLTHTDEGVQRRMIEYWFKPMLHTAARLGANIGFFAHAFENSSLQTPKLYEKKVQKLFENLTELNVYAERYGVESLSLEQMYTPHQYPYRIQDAQRIIREVYSRSGRNFYITEDVGHHLKKFVQPGAEEIRKEIINNRNQINKRAPWIGSDIAYEYFDKAVKGKEIESCIKNIAKNMALNHHLFAHPIDGDCYEWLRALGAYSPIIHLQQTNGTQSAHWYFDEENNKKGVITPRKVLKALKQSYDTPPDKTMGSRVRKIYLTLEMFAGTSSINYETIKKYKESVDYWREYIKDGMRLDQLIEGK